MRLGARIIVMKEKRSLKDIHASAVFCICAFLIPCAVWLLLCARLGITPFGDRTFLYDDMKRQYVHFYAYYRRIWSGGADPFYSFSLGTGSDMTGFFAYYLMSPFLIPFAFINTQLLPSAVTFMLIAKAGFCGLTSWLFLKTHCRCGNSPVLLIFSTSYALCAWQAANITNSMWVDVLIMLPVVLLLTDGVLKGEKRALAAYGICTALMVLFNYYIAYMVLLFLLLWCLLSADSIRAFLRWGIATASGCALTAVMTLPSFLSLTGSNKNLQDKLLSAAGRNIWPSDVLSKLFSLAYDPRETFFGMPNVYVGMALLFPAVLFFADRRIGRREKIRNGVLLGILLLSFCIRKINLVWHAGAQPEGYLYRYSFLFSLVLLICACRETVLLVQDRGKAAGGIPKRAVILAGILEAAVLAAVCFGTFAYLDAAKKAVSVLLAAAGTLLTAAAAGYAPAGRGRKTAVCVLLLGLLQTADLAVNAGYIYRMSSMQQMGKNEFISAAAETGDLVEQIRQEDPGFYRMETVDPRTENESMLYGFSGIASYNSVTQVDNRMLLGKLGYNDSYLETLYGCGSTYTARALLGVRYEIRDHKICRLENSLSPASASTWSAEEILDLSDKAEMAGDPFTFAEKLLMYDIPGFPGKVFREAVMTKVGGEAPEDPEVREASDVPEGLPEGWDRHIYLVECSLDGPLWFYMSGTYEQPLNMLLYTAPCADGCRTGAFSLLSGYGNSACRGVLEMGDRRKGEQFLLAVCMEKGEELPGEIFLCTEDLETLSNAVSARRSDDAVITALSASELCIALPQNRDYRTLTLAIPYGKGWKASVDGQRVEPQQIFEDGMLIPLDTAAGSRDGRKKAETVTLVYRARGLGAGILVSAVTALIYAVYIFMLFRGQSTGDSSGNCRRC